MSFWKAAIYAEILKIFNPHSDVDLKLLIVSVRQLRNRTIWNPRRLEKGDKLLCLVRAVRFAEFLFSIVLARRTIGLCLLNWHTVIIFTMPTSLRDKWRYYSKRLKIRFIAPTIFFAIKTPSFASRPRGDSKGKNIIINIIVAIDFPFLNDTGLNYFLHFYG